MGTGLKARTPCLMKQDHLRKCACARMSARLMGLVHQNSKENTSCKLQIVHSSCMDTCLVNQTGLEQGSQRMNRSPVHPFAFSAATNRPQLLNLTFHTSSLLRQKNCRVAMGNMISIIELPGVYRTVSRKCVVCNGDDDRCQAHAKHPPVILSLQDLAIQGLQASIALQLPLPCRIQILLLRLDDLCKSRSSCQRPQFLHWLTSLMPTSL